MIIKKNIGKRGVVTESFNIITAVVIMSIILLFGGISVYKLINNAASVESAQFRNDFNSEIKDISSKYGSVKFLTMDGLKGYDYFCIFDLDYSTKIISNFDTYRELRGFSIIKGDLADGTANIFLLSNAVEERFLNKVITISDEKGFICEEINAGGFVKIKLEGLGKKVRVSFAK